MPRQRTRWDGETVAECLRAYGRGLTFEEVESATGVPAATVRTWSRGTVPAAGRRALSGRGSCQGCGEEPHDFAALAGTPYTYVLGVYLGDGTICQTAVSTWMRVACDAGYPGLIDEMAAAIGQLRGRQPSRALRRSCDCVVITSNWKQWPCFFPQHGPGEEAQPLDRARELAARTGRA